MHFDLQTILALIGAVAGLIGTLGHVFPQFTKAGDVADKVNAIDKVVSDHLTTPAKDAHPATDAQGNILPPGVKVT